MSQPTKHLARQAIDHLKQKSLSRLERFIVALLGLGIFLFTLIMAQSVHHSREKKAVPSLLPAISTVGYVEFSNLSLPVKLQAFPLFSTSSLGKIMEGWLGFNYEGITPNWTHHPFGIAFLKDFQNMTRPVFFAEISSQRKTLKAFEALLLPDEALEISGPTQKPMYTYPDGKTFSFLFADAYVFVGQPDLLALIQEVGGEANSIIQGDETFIHSLANLPKQSWMRGYLNTEGVVFRDNLPLNNAIQPLRFAVNHFAWTVRQNPNGFHFNTFVNLNKNLLELKKGLFEKEKFTHRLADFITSEKLGVYLGGENLSAEWQSTLETTANLNPAYGVILESVVRAQVKQMFGEEVDLRNDLYPLFEGEYGLAIGRKEDGSLRFSLLLAHDDQVFMEKKMDKLMEGFRTLAAQFTPKMHTVILPDGTESRELVANDERPQEKVKKAGDAEIHCVEVEDSPNAFCYMITENLIAMANNREDVENAVSLSTSPESALSQYLPFRQTLNNVSKVSDEITFISLPQITPFIESHPYGMLLKPFLEEFEAASWVKHYFEDGVSVDGYLLLK